ncbi:MAG TPA: ATP-binding protein [Candidatus Competibacteraceae bacterium]|nr:ATP-binding protein [Candidatus Competibacteraceae bacterium]
MWIQRHISEVVERAFAQFPALVLSGARQAGKTSLVRHLFPQADYVTLDIPRDAETARLDPSGFLAGRREPLILDEVQYVPELPRHLKIAIDRDRRPGRFILTGSQDFSLMQGVSESLAGRCAVLSLPTLSLAEAFPTATLQEMDAFCWRGGFPELWQRPDLDHDLWLGSYVATYLERDVRNSLKVGSLRDFDRFLRAAALRVGQLLSLAELARDVGIAPNTAKSWLSILQASRLVILLEPYHRSPGKRLIKTPKLYFADSGLLIYLLGFTNWAAVIQNAAWGALWENLVIAEAWRYFLNAGRRPPLWFWRTAQGEELDLLIEIGPQRFLAVECKVAAAIERRHLKGFHVFEEVYGPAALYRGAVVCRTDQPYPLIEHGRIAALPLGGTQGLCQWIGEQIAV